MPMLPIGVVQQQGIGGGAAPVTLFEDLFNVSAQSTTLSNHRANTDTDWVGFGWSSSWLIWTANDVIPGGGSNNQVALFYSGHYNVNIECNIVWTGSTTKQAGIALRADVNSNANLWYIVVDGPGNATPQLRIVERNASLNTDRDSTAMTSEGSLSGETWLLKASASGNDIHGEITVNGTTYEVDYTSSFNNQAVWHGMMADGQAFRHNDIKVTGLLDAAFSPASIASCELLLNAADRGVTTNRWDDLSGNNNDFNAASAGEFPSFSSGIATFDGTDDHLDGPDFVSSFTEGEIFYQIKAANDPGSPASASGWDQWGSDTSADTFVWTDGDLYIGFGTSSRKSSGDPARGAMDVWRTIDIWSRTNDFSLTIDNFQDYTHTGNVVGFTTTPTIGYSTSPDRWLKADVKAIVVFSEKLSADNRRKMVNWLVKL